MRKYVDKMPTWQETDAKRDIGETLDELESFIFHCEPEDETGSKRFRRGLRKLIASTDLS